MLRLHITLLNCSIRGTCYVTDGNKRRKQGSNSGANGHWTIASPSRSLERVPSISLSTIESLPLPLQLSTVIKSNKTI